MFANDLSLWLSAYIFLTTFIFMTNYWTSWRLVDMNLSSVKTCYKGVQFICDLFRQVFTNLFLIVLSQGFTFFQPIIFWDGKKFLHVYRLIKAVSVDCAWFRDVANRSRVSHVFIVTTLQDPLKDTAILTKSYQQTKYSADWWARLVSRVVTKISSFRVNTTSRRRIKRLGISCGSIFLLFSNKSSWGPLS